MKPQELYDKTIELIKWAYTQPKPLRKHIRDEIKLRIKEIKFEVSPKTAKEIGDEYNWFWLRG